MKTNLKAWAEYFESVLGVSEVLVPRPAEQALGLGASKSISVLFLHDQALSHQAEELLEKMISAMKISRSEVQFFVTGTNEPPSAQYYICFSKVVFDSLPGANKVLSLSPEELLQNPNLKKRAWDDLQFVMRALR